MIYATLNITCIIISGDDFMSDEFIITPKDEESVQISIRIEKRIRDSFDEIAKKSGRSRNELINLALDYALKNARLVD